MSEKSPCSPNCPTAPEGYLNSFFPKRPPSQNPANPMKYPGSAPSPRLSKPLQRTQVRNAKSLPRLPGLPSPKRTQLLGRLNIATIEVDVPVLSIAYEETNSQPSLPNRFHVVSNASESNFTSPTPPNPGPTEKIPFCIPNDLPIATLTSFNLSY